MNVLHVKRMLYYRGGAFSGLELHASHNHGQAGYYNLAAFIWICRTPGACLTIVQQRLFICKSFGPLCCGFLRAAPIPQVQAAIFNLIDPYIESTTVLSDQVSLVSVLFSPPFLHAMVFYRKTFTLVDIQSLKNLVTFNCLYMYVTFNLSHSLDYMYMYPPHNMELLLLYGL